MDELLKTMYDVQAGLVIDTDKGYTQFVGHVNNKCVMLDWPYMLPDDPDRPDQAQRLLASLAEKGWEMVDPDELRPGTYAHETAHEIVYVGFENNGDGLQEAIAMGIATLGFESGSEVKATCRLISNFVELDPFTLNIVIE